MSTVNPTIAYLGENTAQLTFANMGTADVGAPIGKNWSDYADRSVAIKGTFGAGGTLVVEGSDTGAASYVTLNDQSDNALSFTAAKNEQIVQNPPLTRARPTAGDGTTSLTAVFTLKRAPLQRS